MYKAIIVDDEPMILDGIDDLVSWEEFGIELSAKARDGLEALRELQNGPDISILLTDIRMPGIDGLELLRRLRESGREIKVIVLSGYDDFKYVKEASRYGIENYLLKPIEEAELTETLLNVVDKLENEKKSQLRIQESFDLLRENILYRWVNRQITEDEFIMRAEFLHLNHEADFYLICIVRPLGLFEDSSPIRHAAYRSPFMAEGPLTECTKEMFLTPQADLVLLLAWNGNELPSCDIRGYLEQWMNGLREHLGMDVFLAMGSAVEGFRNVHESYRKASRLLEYRLILPPNSIVSPADYVLSASQEADIPPVDFDAFRGAFLRGELHTACVIIERSFAAHTAPETVRGLTFEFLSQLSISFERPKNNSFYRDLFSDDLLLQLFDSIDTPRIVQLLQQCVERAMQCRTQSVQETSPLILTVLREIEQHYDQPYSLKTLSAKYRINAAYLGQLFKNTTGELFSNYLCNIRIDRAKMLLRETNLKASEIAVRVGFHNANYFSNIFKKMVGIYPTEYRAKELCSIEVS